MPQRRTDCSVLYVCRQLYDEAIRLFYELNIFHFWNPWLLGDFSDAASFMGNVKFITSLSIVVDLWDNSKNPELWKQWHGFLGEESHGGGLSWYFPGLKSLDIDFEPSSRMKERWGYSYVDGQPCSLYRRRLNQRPYCRQSGFDSFVDTLRRTVRVKKVSMCHLHDQELMFALKQEMMGLKVSSADWLPQNVYDPAVPSLRLEWGWQAEIEAEDEAAQSHAGDWGTSEAWD
ncbi:hypothetical protein MMC30_001538 [Trapelia coarctata]|nr:hypothetical protein [Trapelia coarctata]